jgi:hypothetical protein
LPEEFKPFEEVAAASLRVEDGETAGQKEGE